VRRAGLAVALALAGCGGSSHHAPTNPTVPAAPTTTIASTTTTTTSQGPTLAKGFTLTSPAFKQNGRIPTRYTCDGAGTPIPLRWSGVPRNAKELVLIMRDPDAPGAPFVHWAIAGISPRATTPTGINGQNSAGKSGYVPPCPPPGKPHHYVITLNALSGPSNLKPGFTPDELRTSAVGLATLIGRYARR
jgi:Raf kinase inhibitor-like YbhB/YbcL family protein